MKETKKVTAVEFLENSERIARKIGEVSGLAEPKTSSEAGQAMFAMFSCLKAAREAYSELYERTKELYQMFNKEEAPL